MRFFHWARRPRAERCGDRVFRHTWALTLLLALGAEGAFAQEPPADPASDPASDGAVTFTFRTSLKSSVLWSLAPDDPALYPDRETTTGFWRLRFEPTVRFEGGTNVEVALEQRWRAFSSSGGELGGGVLPSEAPAPYRIRQMDWQVASSDHGAWYAEIDRAAVHAQVGAATVSIGRQAVGWGRGVMFGAVDLFSPFTPLEADREWRRGVDAVRADVKLSDRNSLDAIAAFGASVDESAFAARLRGYAGKADLEIVGGWRAKDIFGGVTASAAVGDAETHGELAVFRTPAVAGSSAFADDRSIVKAVAGASYRFPLGHGLLVFAEYHYSGFGAASPQEILPLLADPGFQVRYLRGDTQILTRHAVAVLATYEYRPELTFAGQWVQNPADGSGILVPSTTWTLSDRWSALFSGYLPFGSGPVGLTLNSQYGASPLAAFAQVRAYW